MNETMGGAMQVQKPKYLYKYCTANRAVQILRDRYLYLCPPEDLNDLFEGSLGRLLQYTPEVGVELEWRRIRAYTGLDEYESREYVKENIREDEIKANFNYTIEKLKDLNKALRQNSGITCLSEHRGDQRMWGTYGDNHAGVCIEFHNYGADSLIQRHCMPVTYSDERIHEYLPHLIGDDAALDVGLFAYACYFRKSLDWLTEHEWRILMLADSHQTAEDRKMRFAIADVKRVFLGPRIDEGCVQELSKVCLDTSLDWGMYALRGDSDAGATNFVGYETIKSFEDIEYWMRVHPEKKADV